jgi:sirohydrochlorin cobaltochelatase
MLNKMRILIFVHIAGAIALLSGCASSPPSAVMPPATSPAATVSAAPSASSSGEARSRGVGTPTALPAGRGAAPPVGSSDLGVLIMAHGGSPAWNEAVLDAVKPLRAHHEIEVAFGMADATTLQEAVTRLEGRNARRIAVVRLFVSGESFLDQTEKIFGLVPGAPAPPAAAPAAHAGHGSHASHGGHSMAFHRVATRSSFALSLRGLIDADGMGTILADRVAALSKAPAQEDVLILAHGPGDDAENARWLAKLDTRAAAVRAKAPFRRVQVETLREDWPDKRAEAEARIRAYVKRARDEGGRAIVIPFRVQGFGPYAKVLEGLDYIADQKGLIPHPEVGKWIEHEIRALDAGPFRAPVAP